MEDMNHEHNHDHTHNHDHDVEYEFEEEELDTHEVAAAAYNRVDALIELLIKKGVISENEFDQMEEEMFFDEDMDEEDQPEPASGSQL